MKSGIVLVSNAGGGGAANAAGGWTPISLTNGDASPITIGQVCYLSASDTARKAQSDGTEAEARCVAICIDASIAPAAAGRFVFGGRLAAAGAGHTFAEVGYLSATLGAIAAVPNLTLGQYNTILGYWLNATDFQFSPQLPILN